MMIKEINFTKKGVYYFSEETGQIVFNLEIIFREDRGRKDKKSSVQYNIFENGKVLNSNIYTKERVKKETKKELNDFVKSEELLEILTKEMKKNRIYFMFEAVGYFDIKELYKKDLHFIESLKEI